MAEWPPWEWVPGDPVQAARGSYLFGAFFGVGLSVAVLWALALVGVVVVQVPPPPGYSAPLVTFAAVGIGLGIPPLIFRTQPLVSALGISPAGLRIQLAGPVVSRPGRTIPWWDVRRVGPDWVEVRGLRGFGMLSERYRLTTRQADRLRAFCGMPAV